ncbi:FGGY-family carbohydrate kinase [Pleionea litopenaei]|uniref:FGGY-family carbohydrate kinase n=1 Tax=Pleionea litopenaei TaxID=3070815 RepID=A0AA51RQW7_9GAMM|nr:FGGY-family carbohydrate kinase [Pleionea sp. HL-JVS1]WMS85966.1 FGGY-family carbohydrate kinase [Pleionea sp. HL-JVS1]
MLQSKYNKQSSAVSDLNSAAQFLIIDCGTQSVRALIFDRHGTLIAKSQVPLEGYFSDQPGWVEHHAHYFWDSLCRACQKLWSLPGVERTNIVGMTVTTQRATIICVDKNGEPQRPAITWMDQRTATKLPTIKWWWRLAFKVAGVKQTVTQFMENAEINWLWQHQPDIVQRSEKILLLSGYLNHQLTAQFKDSIGSQVGYLPFDYKRHRWAKKSDWKWQACPFLPKHLPELVSVGGQIGEVTASAAEQTGIPTGLPVIAAAADKACETLGCGALAKHQGQISYGTTATFNILSPKYIEPIRYLPAYPAAVPNFYTCEYQIYRGYWMVSWFKQQFAHKEFLEARETDTSTEALLDNLAMKVPAGSDGLILQPYWSPGVRYPGPEARGAIIGFNDGHTKAHMYRALIEGIAYGLCNGKEKMEKRSGRRVTELFVSGGGAQSETALQVTADIFDLPVLLPHTHETSGLGAAINVAVGLGVFDTYSDAVDSMCHVSRRVEPNPQNVPLYRKLYRQIYRKLYPRLAPFYRIIKNLD